MRTGDLEVLAMVDVDHHPIGIGYHDYRDRDRVWVASHAASLTVLADRG